MYEYSTEAESRTRSGRNPAGLKWIDTNKGSAEAPRYRLRLVCTEVRYKGVEPIFSATLPLETLRVLLGVACQEEEHVLRVEDFFLISTADVSRAHNSADAVSDVYVRLPDEDPKAKQPVVSAKLRKTMYGSLDAAQRWQNIMLRFWRREDFPEAWILLAACSIKACKPTFWCTVTIFFIVDRREGRKHALSFLRGAHELSKVVTLSPESSQSRTISFLGRTLTLRQWGIEYELDQQHVSPALEALRRHQESTMRVAPRRVRSASCAEQQNGVILLKKSKRRTTFSQEKN